MKLIILSILSVAIQNLALANRLIGNGGDVVVCKKDGVKTVELLDFYEARRERGILIELGGPQASVMNKVGMAFERLLRLSPVRAQNYYRWAQEFSNETLFLENVELVDVDDSLHVSVEKGCHLEQIAIQKDIRFPEDKRYTVNLDLWKQLDNDSKAGLIIHEMILREARELGHTDSLSVRHFNSYLASDSLASMGLTQFISYLQSLPLSWLNVQGLNIQIFAPAEYDDEEPQILDPVFYSSGVVRAARVVHGAIYRVGTIEYKLADELDLLNGIRWNSVYFYPNGVLKEARLETLHQLPFAGGVLNSYQKITFHDNGHPEALKLYDQDSYVNLYGEDIRVKSEILFHKNGFINRLHLSDETRISLGREGTWADAFNLVYFHENGLVSRVNVARARVFDGKKFKMIESMTGPLLLDENGFYIDKGYEQ